MKCIYLSIIVPQYFCLRHFRHSVKFRDISPGPKFRSEIMDSGGGGRSKAFKDVVKRLRKGMFTDFTIFLEDNSRFQVHKILLAESSAFFRALFKYCTESKILLKGISRESMSNILGHIYGKEKAAKIDESNVFQVIVDADYLDSDRIRKHCVEIIDAMITGNNNSVISSEFERICKFADDFNLLELQQVCKNHGDWSYDLGIDFSSSSIMEEEERAPSGYNETEI